MKDKKPKDERRSDGPLGGTANSSVPSRDAIVRGVINDLASRDGESEERQMRRLSIAITNSLSRFSLLFAVCNSSARQKKLIETLGRLLPGLTISTIQLNRADANILDRLRSNGTRTDVLMATGIEELLPFDDSFRRETTLSELQLKREQFRELRKPLVLWMPEYVYALLGQFAVDFWSWQSGGFHFDQQQVIATDRDVAMPALDALDSSQGLRAPIFVGRRMELQQAVEALRQGHSVAIIGSAGIGKSSFMRQIAEVARPSFELVVPIEVLDLARLRGDQAVGAVLSAVIRRLSPDARIPEDITSLTALYRTILDHRRALLLIDDVPPDFLARALQPPRGSALVLTSRGTIRDTDFFTLRLDHLSSSDASELLMRLAPNLSGPEVELLASLSEGAPLAIHLLADAISRGGMTPSDFERLASTSKTSFGLQLDQLLARTYDALPFYAAQTLKLMTVFPGSFDQEAEVAICVDVDGRGLTELLRHSLVYSGGPARRFSMHDLVRDFALHKIDPAEQMDGRIRHARHYIGVAERAKEELHQGGVFAEHGRDRFDRELQNIRTAYTFVTENWNGPHDIADLCIRYADACEPFFIPLQRSTEWKALVLAAVAVSKEPKVKARNLGRLGRILTSEGNADEARETYIQQLNAAMEGEDHRVVLEALGNLGSVFHAKGDLDAASRAYEMQLRIATESDDVEGRARALANLASVFYSLGELDRSEEVSRSLLEAAITTNNLSLQITALNNLSLVAVRRGDYSAAKDLSERQVHISRQMGDPSGQVLAISNLGNVSSRLGEYKEAIRYYEMALRMSREVGDLLAEQRLFSSLGRVYVAVGQRDRAADLLERALELAQGLNDRGGELSALNSLGELHLLIGDTRRATEDYQRALDLARTIGDKRLEVVGLMNMSELAVVQGDRTRALEAIASARSILSTLSEDDASALRRNVDRWNLALDNGRLATATVALVYPLLPSFRGSLDDAKAAIASAGDSTWQAAYSVFKLLQEQKDLAPLLRNRKLVPRDDLSSVLAEVLFDDLSLAFDLADLILGARNEGEAGHTVRGGRTPHIHVGGDIVNSVIITGDQNTIGTLAPESATPAKRSGPPPRAN